MTIGIGPGSAPLPDRVDWEGGRELACATLVALLVKVTAVTSVGARLNVTCKVSGCSEENLTIDTPLAYVRCYSAGVPPAGCC